ncbi:arylamine N-acetyltransferase family protein [Parapedomonas caeni]
MLTPAQRDAYLARLGLTTAPATTPDGLADLHAAHMMAVPFENFDIHLGQGISLDPEAVYDKVVARRRGGYCFELNGLFLRLLAALEVEARPLLARVWLAPGGPHPRTHKLCLVELGGRPWIFDIGFGGPGFRLPMPLETGRVDDQPDGRFRLREDADHGFMLETGRDDGWLGLYSFTLERCWPADFELGNHYTATAPDSLFTQRRLAARFTADGRLTLLDHQLTTRAGGIDTTETLADDATYLDVLRTRFGIDLDVPYHTLKAPCPVSA